MNVVVTGGGTIAPIDDVRTVTNVSTGQFSSQISEACLARECSVWHVHARSALLPFHRLARLDLDAKDPSDEVHRLAVLQMAYDAAKSRLQLRPLIEGTVADYQRTLREVFHETRIDVAFLSMAVSDYEPEPFAGKISSDRDELLLRLRPTPKVIRSVRDWAPSAYLVGFKLLSGSRTDELIERAHAACITNRVDLTVANDLTSLRDGRHTLYLVRPRQEVETLGPGELLAARLVDRVLFWAREYRG